MIAVALTLMLSSAILYADFLNVIILDMHERLGFSLQTAGDISSLDLGCTAVGALAGALFARRLVGGRWIVAYLAAIAALDALSIFPLAWQALAILRSLHGLACGGLLACCGAALSRQARAERIVGASLAVQLVLASAGAQLLPAVIRRHGTGIAFIVMGAVELLTLAVVLRAFGFFAALAPDRDAASAPRPPLPAQARLLCGASMGALFLFQFARFMVVGYGFQIGGFFALSSAFVGLVIGAGNWLSGAGAVVATLLPSRLGRRWPLLLAGAGNLLAAVALIRFGAHPAVFALATGASALLTFIALPYHYGVCFAIDEGGALGTWTGFVSKLGLALGPASGAWLMGRHSLPGVLWISALLVFAATLLACWPARRIDRAG